MTNITLDSNIKQINYNETDNVKGVRYKLNSTYYKVWGHPYNFKWDFSTYLSTTSYAELLIPSKDFIYSKDNVVNVTCVGSSYNSNAYMPHDTYSLARATNNTVYYGDNISWTSKSWTADTLDPCINSIYCPSCLNLSSDTNAIVAPLIKTNTSFIKCQLSSSMTQYFASLEVTYDRYDSSSRELTITSNSNNPIYIASVTGKYAYAYWNLNGGNDYQYMLGTNAEFKGDWMIPLWTKVYTYTQFPTTQYQLNELTLPSYKSSGSASTIPTIMKVSAKLTSPYFNFSNMSTSMTKGTYFDTISFSWQLNWTRTSISNYMYYTTRIVALELSSSSQYDPTSVVSTSSDGFNQLVDSSIITSEEIHNNYFRTFYITSLWSFSGVSKIHHILWNVEVLGSNDKTNWEVLGVYGTPTYSQHTHISSGGSGGGGSITPLEG